MKGHPTLYAPRHQEAPELLAQRVKVPEPCVHGIKV